MRLLGKIGIVFQDLTIGPGLLERFGGAEFGPSASLLPLQHHHYDDPTLLLLLLGQCCPVNIQWGPEVPTLILDAQLARFPYTSRVQGTKELYQLAAFGIRLTPTQPGFRVGPADYPSRAALRQVANVPKQMLGFDIGNGLLALEVDLRPGVSSSTRPIPKPVGFRRHKLIPRPNPGSWE
jgi:hypothetical protein